jgi:NADH:ubiquinone oxidoreductase subunit F (NADH-binding)
VTGAGIPEGTGPAGEPGVPGDPASPDVAGLRSSLRFPDDSGPVTTRRRAVEPVPASRMPGAWEAALARLPEVLCLGQPRLTAGLDRSARLNLAAHHAVFGPLPRLSATQLVKIASAVDLRGRGGAAFPLARKISAVLASARVRRCGTAVLVNAAEGEPGSAKDRMLLLRSPYLVLGGAMVAAWALGSREVVVGAADPQVAQSVRDAAGADPELGKLIRVAEIPDRFVSGEGGALMNAVNGRAAVPPGRKVLPSDRGVGGLPTLLSNAETFAQLAVLSMLGPEGYATAGTAGQPGTVLLTVGGSAGRPAVVEVPAGRRLGDVLDLCSADSEDGVLVGGYHGAWIPAELAEDLPVSRAGVAAAGGSLGAGIVLPLGRASCPLGEVARVARYLASHRLASAARANSACPASPAPWARWLMALAGPTLWTRPGAVPPPSGVGAPARTLTGPTGSSRRRWRCSPATWPSISAGAPAAGPRRAFCRCRRRPAGPGWSWTGLAAAAMACVLTSCRS